MSKILKIFKTYIKNNIFYKSRLISYIFFFFYSIKIFFLKFFNTFFVKYIDIGSGPDMEEFFWLNYDYQLDSNVIDKDFKIHKKNISIVYCSHFLEHVDDITAKSVFLQSYNSLKNDGVFRIVVPDQNYFINLYKTGNKKKLQEIIGEYNLSTWHLYNTSTESLEQLLVANIVSIGNLNHKLTKFKHKENLKSKPPVLLVPGAPGGITEKLKGYYCGPPINVSDDLIKEKLMQLDTHNFLKFLFSLAESGETKTITEGIFNSWHKNDWPFEKIKLYAKDAGFTKIIKSEYLEDNQIFSKKREGIWHKPYSLYVNCIR